jgi:hypothetical protein
MDAFSRDISSYPAVEEFAGSFGSGGTGETNPRKVEVMATLRWVQKWLWDVHGLTCQEATRLAARAMDKPLTIGERVRLFLHGLLCGYCRNYARQLRLLHQWARRVALPTLRPSDPACRRLQPLASKENSKAKSLELTEVLLDAHDHRIRPHQVFDASLAKADLAHPSLAIRACIIKSARCFDKHVQAHEQSE